MGSDNLLEEMNASVWCVYLLCEVVDELILLCEKMWSYVFSQLTKQHSPYSYSLGMGPCITMCLWLLALARTETAWKYISRGIK